MKCPICNLELEDSRKVLGLSQLGIKHFHLEHAHTFNLLHDLVNFVAAISFHHRDCGNKITTLGIGDSAVELNKRAKEIKYAGDEKWEGEDENLFE